MEYLDYLFFLACSIFTAPEHPSPVSQLVSVSRAVANNKLDGHLKQGRLLPTTEKAVCNPSMDAFNAYPATATTKGNGYRVDSLSRYLESEYYGAGDGAVDEAAVGDHGEDLCNHYWSGTEGLVVLAVALFSGVFARLVLNRTKIPYTVLLTCMGALLGIFHDIFYEVRMKCCIHVASLSCRLPSV